MIFEIQLRTASSQPANKIDNIFSGACVSDFFVRVEGCLRGYVLGGSDCEHLRTIIERVSCPTGLMSSDIEDGGSEKRGRLGKQGVKKPSWTD